jgi:ABC-2 type transport system ATP-binding protein
MAAMPSPSAIDLAPAIETHDLVKRYGRTTALAGLTMRVERGEVFGFLGPNGAGKTTSVKLLLGLTPPSSGGGTVLGRPLGDREARRRVGYLPEMFRYQPWMRAREVLAFHAGLIGLEGVAGPAAVAEALETVGLADRSDDLVGTYSKGMQQRLGLATALLGRPELVLLDEPTSALDPLGRTEVRGIIRAARDRGATVFLNSHLLSEVELVCDRVAVVDAGRVVAAGTLDELLGGDGVRLRVTGLDAAARAGLAAFGPHAADGDWLAFRPFAPDRIPELVAAVVAAGGRIHAVEPERASLEERFLGLIAGGRAG